MEWETTSRATLDNPRKTPEVQRRGGSQSLPADQDSSGSTGQVNLGVKVGSPPDPLSVKQSHQSSPLVPTYYSFPVNSVRSLLNSTVVPPSWLQLALSLLVSSPPGEDSAEFPCLPPEKLLTLPADVTQPATIPRLSSLTPSTTGSGQVLAGSDVLNRDLKPGHVTRDSACGTGSNHVSKLKSIFHPAGSIIALGPSKGSARGHKLFEIAQISDNSCLVSCLEGLTTSISSTNSHRGSLLESNGSANESNTNTEGSLNANSTSFHQPVSAGHICQNVSVGLPSSAPLKSITLPDQTLLVHSTSNSKMVEHAAIFSHLYTPYFSYSQTFSVNQSIPSTTFLSQLDTVQVSDTRTAKIPGTSQHLAHNQTRLNHHSYDCVGQNGQSFQSQSDCQPSSSANLGSRNHQQNGVLFVTRPDQHFSVALDLVSPQTNTSQRQTANFAPLNVVASSVDRCHRSPVIYDSDQNSVSPTAKQDSVCPISTQNTVSPTSIDNTVGTNATRDIFGQNSIQDTVRPSSGSVGGGPEYSECPDYCYEMDTSDPNHVQISVAFVKPDPAKIPVKSLKQPGIAGSHKQVSNQMTTTSTATSTCAITTVAVCNQMTTTSTATSTCGVTTVASLLITTSPHIQPSPHQKRSKVAASLDESGASGSPLMKCLLLEQGHQAMLKNQSDVASQDVPKTQTRTPKEPSDARCGALGDNIIKRSTEESPLAQECHTLTAPSSGTCSVSSYQISSAPSNVTVERCSSVMVNAQTDSKFLTHTLRPLVGDQTKLATSLPLKHLVDVQRKQSMPLFFQGKDDGSVSQVPTYITEVFPAPAPTSVSTSLHLAVSYSPTWSSHSTVSSHSVDSPPSTISSYPVVSSHQNLSSHPVVPSAVISNSLETSPKSSSATSTSSFSSSSSSSSTSANTSGVESGRRLRCRNQRKFLPEKTRHKRRTLQDMTRPLKQWLYRHRDNPYPTKSEKVDLVNTSHMTLTQISNWFANARRRLKNTVRGENVSWAHRIKAYNSCAEGNVELFSIPSSDEEDLVSGDEGIVSDDRQDPITSSSTSPVSALASPHGHASLTSPIATESSLTSPGGTTRSSPALDDQQGCYHKYKHTILQRYLHDSSQQTLLPDEDLITSQRHRHLSSSTGSHDFEYLSTSSVSSPSHETHHDSFDEFSEEFETIAIRRRISERQAETKSSEDIYWKEIGAALALTSLARAQVNK